MVIASLAIVVIVMIVAGAAIHHAALEDKKQAERIEKLRMLQDDNLKKGEELLLKIKNR